MDLVGKIIANRYEIKDQIGEGGMAYVYKARCKLLNRDVAIKVLKSEFSKDETFVKRFKAEAQSAASLIHPNIVSVFDVGEEDNINYIVMELLETKTLKDYILEKGNLSNEETLKISLQIASGLAAAHKANIVHRDIKPQNIVLSKDMVAKVTDFGIAKATTSATITNFGSTMGSVHYFSPEHAKGGFTDQKSDIYSLGIVMYEMATGKVPFDGESAVSIALKHIQQKPVEPMLVNTKISTDLNNIILKAIAKNTINRYKSADELTYDINEALSDVKYANKPSAITSGVTQVIPTVDADIVEEDEVFVVPNLRTKNSVRKSSVNLSDSSYRKSGIINEDKSDPYIKDESEVKVKKVKKDKKIMTISLAVGGIILLLLGIIFAVYLVDKVDESSLNVDETYIVPNLIGRDYEEVKEEYLAQGINIVQSSSEYNELDEGLVIFQSIEKGTEATDKNISVVVSKGQKLVKLTNIVGKDIKVATYELEKTLGFIVEVEYKEDQEIAKDIVMSQEQVAGEEYSYGSIVKIVVSSGDGKVKVVMPNVVGAVEAVAKADLEKLKLVVNVKYESDTTKANGVVLKQSYKQNEELSEGDLVEITVNKLLLSKEITIPLADLGITYTPTVENESDTDNGNSGNGTEGSTDNSTKDKKESEVTDNLKTYEIEVLASVDGSAENTVFSKSVTADTKSISFTINGYVKASYKVSVDGKVVMTKDINF